jgi:hypothetical protein
MKRKAIIITIIVVALILVAVASWLIYKKYFKKDGTEDSDSKLDDAPTTSPPTTTTTSYPIPPEVKDVKSFQVYANAKGYKPKLETKTGKWGPASAAAWKVLGNDYKKYLLASSPITIAPGQKNVPLYAKFNTAIWDNVNDWIPYRLANQNEYIGTTDGTIVENSNKNKFYKLNFTATTTKYVRVENVTMSSNWSSNIQTLPTFLQPGKI